MYCTDNCSYWVDQTIAFRKTILFYYIKYVEIASRVCKTTIHEIKYLPSTLSEKNIINMILSYF